MKWPISLQNPISLDQINLLIQRCLKSKSLSLNKQVHCLLLTSGIMINANTPFMSLDSKIVGLYASCGDTRSAKSVFDEIPRPTVFAVNWMVLASAFNGSNAEAFGYFSRMRELGRACNRFTFSIVLKACIGMEDVNKGREVHAVLCKEGLVGDVPVGNALVDAYGKCGKLDYARKVFDGMPERDVASWTAMICGCVNTGSFEDGVGLFGRMVLEGLRPNEFTWNTVISGYAKRGDWDSAMAAFDGMKSKGLIPDLVTWNALISGFVQSRLAEEALKLFRHMLESGIRPNNVTVTGLLPACGSLISIRRGREIHGLVYRMGLQMNVYVASALVDMYSKCGSVKDASNVFQAVTVKNIASWNAMIGCYGKHNMVESAVHLFEKMKQEGIAPNEVTFVSVLSACSHGGLVDKGLEIFRSIKEDDDDVPVLKEHYACMVDLLCRAGRMEEAYHLLKAMSKDATESMLGAFFNGCLIHGRSDMAESLADDINTSKLTRPGSFIALSNLFAAGGGWKGVEDVRGTMQGRNITKKPGYSRL